MSQIALTDAACKEVYASAGYESSAQNFPRTTLKSDNVFGDDGGIYQLATMSGLGVRGLHGRSQRHRLGSPAGSPGCQAARPEGAGTAAGR